MESLIIALVVFLIIDFSLRYFLRWQKTRKDEQLRKNALEKGLRYDYSSEASTLKRVDLTKPKARILCVDDEPLILDSMRKILVLDGYAVDTVEKSREALNLVQFHHYDFALLDLKIPEIDGVSLTEWLAQLRPDIDIIIITGYPSLESAVATMKSGAREYLQKPFTPDELKTIVSNCLIQRIKRLERENIPRIRVLPMDKFHTRCTQDFVIPAGIFISRNHCWLELNQDGTVNVGMDDFAKRVIGNIENLELPGPGLKVARGGTLFVIHTNNRSITFASPVKGNVVKSNNSLIGQLDDLEQTTYGKNWFCQIATDDIEEDLKYLMIGKSAQQFFEDEIEDCCSLFKPLIEATKASKEQSGGNGSFWGNLNNLAEKEWKRLIDRFFEN